MFDLTGRTALVTGSTQGIGFEIARLFSKHGAKVFVNGASSDEKCLEASKKIPNSVPVRADLLHESEIERLYGITGGVDILVLCASVQYKREWDGYTDDEIESQLTINFKSSYLLIKKYALFMRNQNYGRILTVGSVNQYNNHPLLSFYAATKAAQKKLAENIAPALAPFNVTVNNLSPGAIATKRNEKALSDAETYAKTVASIPAGYVGTPADIAPAALLLCSDEGRYITGADLIIDGGMHL